MKRMLAIAAMLSAAPLFAQPVLTIPPEIPAAGDYVTLTPQTDAKAVTYIGLSGIDPFPSGLLKDPRTFVLAVRGLPEGRYRFAAVGTLDDAQAVVTFTVVVGAPPAPVPPGPDPVPPTPTPDPLGLVKVSRDGALKVEPTARASGAGKLAQANRSHASAVAAGAFLSPATILDGWRKANNDAVPAGPWAPWGQAVSQKLEELYRAGRFSSNADWARALNDVATGLEVR